MNNQSSDIFVRDTMQPQLSKIQLQFQSNNYYSLGNFIILAKFKSRQKLVIIINLATESTLMVTVKCALIRFDHYSQLLFSLSHRHRKIVALFSSDRQKNFYELLKINIGSYESIECLTFQQFLSRTAQEQSALSERTIMVMDIPKDWHQLYSIITKNQEQSKDQIILVLPAILKKYLNFIAKKFAHQSHSIQLLKSQYTAHQLVDINSKIRELVQSSYDINRAGFYAYGAYIRNYQENQLKSVFRTSSIFLDELAKSFGFTYAPRVKGQGFVKKSGKKQKLKTKTKPQQKLKSKKKSEKVISKSKKIKEVQKKVAPKTKIISKDKIVKKSKKVVKQ